MSGVEILVTNIILQNPAQLRWCIKMRTSEAFVSSYYSHRMARSAVANLDFCTAVCTRVSFEVCVSLEQFVEKRYTSLGTPHERKANGRKVWFIVFAELCCAYDMATFTITQRIKIALRLSEM